MGDDRLLSTLICVENINVIPFEIVSFWFLYISLDLSSYKKWII